MYRRAFSLTVAVLFVPLPFVAHGQTPQLAAVQITDTPTAVDPAKLVPASVNRHFTVAFDEASFGDVVNWLEAEAELTVIVNERSLENAGILKSEPVSDRLQNEPLFLLLDRLESIAVTWWLDDEILHLAADDELYVYTRQYGVGDLFDNEVDPDSLQSTIVDCIAPDSWEEAGGTATVVLLGDVLFVRQSNRNHRRVAGLLDALRNHGRRTIVDDPQVHAEIRKALNSPVSVRYRQEALVNVVSSLSETTGLDIRLDLNWLQAAGIRDRLPIDLDVTGQALEVALNVLASQYDLDWHLRDGALWITTAERTQEGLTAVFDVRDLCRNFDESMSLESAITSQACPYDWVTSGGNGIISFPLPGSMVVYQPERNMNEVLLLLENYRAALRVSKPRQKPGTDPKEVITRYYRMPKVVASDLSILLPELLSPDTWKSDQNPSGIGYIRFVNSQSEIEYANKTSGLVTTVPYAVLIIDQMREVHDEIPTILNRIMQGDERLSKNQGLGGGGFGGGFFNVPVPPPKRSSGATTPNRLP